MLSSQVRMTGIVISKFTKQLSR